MAPTDETAVSVWFDGACIKNPAGESRLWGYGYRVVGAGLDHEGCHANLSGHLLFGLSGLVGVHPTDDDLAAFPRVIRSIHVADLDGALEALCHLKNQGFSSSVTLYGDSKSLNERLRAGRPVRPGSADHAAISYRERFLGKLREEFDSVGWEWVRRNENAAANRLAWSAVHEIIEHKKMWLKAAKSHPETFPGGWLWEIVAEHLLPGDTLDYDIAQMQCMCGRCKLDRRPGGPT